MKFTKLDFKNYSIQEKLKYFDNTLYFNNGNIIQKGTFSNYCIGVTFQYSKNKKKTPVNINKFEQYLRNDEYSYYTELYDLVSDKIENNFVYCYYFYGCISQDNIFTNIKINTGNKLKEIKNEFSMSKLFQTNENKKRKETESIFSKNVIKEIIPGVSILTREETIKYSINTYKKYFLFNNILYYCSIEKEPHRYTQEQLELLLKEYVYKESKKFDDIKEQLNVFERTSLNKNNKKREPISNEVKFEVWRRDGGKCVICGSNEKLEFDHIIPFSKGGSNTARNIQILCEVCNRKKSNKI